MRGSWDTIIGGGYATVRSSALPRATVRGETTRAFGLTTATALSQRPEPSSTTFMPL